MIPRASRSHDQIKDASQSDPDIHVLTNLSDLEINALQRVSGLCVQKSLREGFGLVVSEALWKGTPVVAGRVGGIPLQLADGTGRLLVDDTTECAEAIVELLGDSERADELGRSGQERVREHFLLPRLLLSELALLGALARNASVALLGAGDYRDPVCGLVVAVGNACSTEHDRGEGPRFCSKDCRERYVLSPETYMDVRGQNDVARSRS